MNSILIGKDAAGRPVYVTPEMRLSTHTHVIGGSGTGKSKFLEWLMRKDIREGHGFCLIDWHGTLYSDIVRYCAHLDVGLDNDFRQIIQLNPSQPDFITGFNPFMNAGEDISTEVSRRINATIRPWGVSDTNEMPTFERITRLLYTFMAETKQTLPNAANLLDPERRELREYAATVGDDEWVKSQWHRLQSIKTTREWEDRVLSTENRLARFIGSKGVRRFMGLTYNNIDLMDIMDSGKILLVNLGASDFLDEEAARVFASLFLYEFMHTAMRRANRSVLGEKPKHYILYLDEFQEYITDDVAAMLEQVRKGGLHMVLSHQHLSQLVRDGNERLKDSIFTNCRIKAVFGGLPYKSAEELANEMFLPDLNTRQIKKAYYHTMHLYEEQTRTVRSHAVSRGTTDTSGTSSGSSSGSSSGIVVSSGRTVPGTMPGSAVEGWFTDSRSKTTADSVSDFAASSDSHSETESETEGETVVPVWVPIPTQELVSEVEWSREDKLSQTAEMLKEQMQRHCFIKLDTETTQPLLVPFVKNYGLSPDSLVEYQQAVYRSQAALPAIEVDRLLAESRQKFLSAFSQTRDPTSAAPESEQPAEQAPDSGLTTPIWNWNRSAPQSNSTSQTTSPGEPSLGSQETAHRNRGPKPDLENHKKVVSIVSSYGEGDAWRTDENLWEICEKLDQEGVPVPKPWPVERKSRSWKVAFANCRDLVRKAITDRCKGAQKHAD